MEQLARAQRYLERMRRIYQGIFSSHHTREEYEDDATSFFLHCFHIRDWILHLNKVGITAQRLDRFIDANADLRICADLCNGSKHCVLTRTPRSGAQPSVAARSYSASTWITGAGGGEVLQARYTVMTASGPRDALELAENCMTLWQGFISDMTNASSGGT